MKKLDLLNAIASRLATITTANGYETDIGLRSSYWQDWDFEYGEVGAITFRDLEEEVTEVNQFQEFLLHLEIEAVAYTSAGSVSEVELGCNLQFDLIRAIGVDPTWGKLAIKTELKETAKQIQTEGKRAMNLTLSFDITYRDPKWLRLNPE